MFCIQYRPGAIDLQIVSSYWQVISTLGPNLNTMDDRILQSLIISHNRSVCLYRSDDLFPDQKTPTYINMALGQENQIDYIYRTSYPCSISDFQVLDPNVNFSYHVPIRISAKLIDTGNTLKTSDTLSNHNDFTISQLRWDKGDKVSYYYHTGQKLLPLVDVLDNMLLDATLVLYLLTMFIIIIIILYYVNRQQCIKVKKYGVARSTAAVDRGLEAADTAAVDLAPTS